MAEFLPEYTPPMSKAQRYNWSAWMKPGNTVRLVKGLDYDCNSANLRVRVSQVAKDRGLKASSYIEDVLTEDGTPVEALVFHLEIANFGPVKHLWMEPEDAPTPAAIKSRNLIPEVK